MYIEIVPNRNSKPAILLREGRRQGQKIIKKTLANLTDWPKEKIELFKRFLKGEPLVASEDAFRIERSLPHGNVRALLGMARRLGLDALLSSRPCRERDLVMAMVLERLIHPASKLGTTRLWDTNTLADELGVGDADENELYRAMDWLAKRQERIEKKLAARHFQEGVQVLYDTSSSYYEGRTCLLARFGNNRDRKRGRKSIVYGLLADSEGRPVAVSVYPGNTGDTKTVEDQVAKLADKFGLTRFVLVGDRGMLTEVRIKQLKQRPGIGWITALRSVKVRKLVEGSLQMSLFDQTHLAEIVTPDFPGERLVACYNPLLAAERTSKREALVQATEKALTKIRAEAARRKKKPLTKEAIALRVGKVINRHKVAKHFRVKIKKGVLNFERKKESIAREAALDGIYVLRTSESAATLTAEDTVRCYKRLSRVERFFRTIKGLDILVRPIHHRLENRVRAHIFICTLAY